MGPTIRRLVVAALVVLAALVPVPVRAQSQPPLEDVTLQGRVLRPDGSPLANTPVRVDARKSTSGFAIFAFFFTAGFSSLSCFDPSSDACILPNTKRFDSTTDATGRYRFTFPKAKRRGEQTNTDYFLSVAMPSSRVGDDIVIAQYELELLTPVHDAPDVVMWDPAAKVVAHERSYELRYDPRPRSSNSLQTFVADAPVDLSTARDRTIDARDIEDATVALVPYASKDERAENTIYHQRFTAAPTPLRGALVPLSRGAPCTVIRKDGARSTECGYTDGDIARPAVADPNPCSYDVNGQPLAVEDPRTGQAASCQAPVSEVVVDLGRSRPVAEVRARGCTCTFGGSADGASWMALPTGTFRARSIRYVRATGSNLGAVPEISAWPEWSDTRVPNPPVVGGAPSPTPLLPPTKTDARPWWLALVAAALLGGVVTATARRLGGSTAAERPNA